MDPTKMTMVQTLLFGAGIGFIVGLIPLITGIIKKDIKNGVIGLIGSVVGGSIASLLLAIPFAAVMTWLIVRGSKPAAQPASDGIENS